MRSVIEMLVKDCFVSAPGKAILHGEHAVVHGKVTCTINNEVTEIMRFYGDSVYARQYLSRHNDIMLIVEPRFCKTALQISFCLSAICLPPRGCHFLSFSAVALYMMISILHCKENTFSNDQPWYATGKTSGIGKYTKTRLD